MAKDKEYEPLFKTDEEFRKAIKQVGKYKLRSKNVWNYQAWHFQKYGYYGLDGKYFIEGTADWLNFWNEEQRRVMEGVMLDGFYVPGLYYFYLNYLPIYHKQKNKYTFPDVYDSDYHTFLCLEHAVLLKQDFAVIKKRQSGFSLKFCVPLIREVFFGRGSPCYIATYEETQVLKTWTEILEPYREHLNEYTAWYRDFSPNKSLNWRTAKETIDNSGRRILQGRKNTLKGLVLSKSPSKGVGGAATWIFADEAGVNLALDKFLGYVKPMITYGNVKTGTIIVSGAVGELKHLEAGLKDLIIKPVASNVYAVDNIWDDDTNYKGKKCGFFVPESWAYFGIDERIDSPFFGMPFIDEYGNSDVERATEYILWTREQKKAESMNAYLFAISQAPLTIAECFQYRSEKVFPIDLINAQIAKIESTNDNGTYVRLVDTKDGLKHKILDKRENPAILEHPIEPGMINKEGVVQIWEFPKIDAPYGLYWAGVDIVRDSESLSSPSVNAIHIYKGYHKLGDEYAAERIVATYKARPRDKMDWYDQAMKLIEFYNAEALVENNVYWFIEETIKSKRQHRIARTPKWLIEQTPQGKSHFTKPYGVNMTPRLFLVMIDALVNYCTEVIYTEFNEKTGEATRHFGVERIKDVQLLREMANYKPKAEQTPKDNYDSLVSFGLALLHAINSEVKGIINSDEEENEVPAMSQKNMRLLLRNNILRGNSYNSFQKQLNKSNYRR